MQINTAPINKLPCLTSTHESDKKASDSKESKVESWSESVKKIGFAKASMQYIGKHPIETAVVVGTVAAAFGLYYILQERTITCPTVVLIKEHHTTTGYASKDYRWVGESKIVQNAEGSYQLTGTAYPTEARQAQIVPEEHKGWLFCPLTREQAEGIAERYIDANPGRFTDNNDVINYYQSLETPQNDWVRNNLKELLRNDMFSSIIPKLQSRENFEVCISRSGSIDPIWLQKHEPKSSVDCNPEYVKDLQNRSKC